ncbi:MAG: efflux transporter outer membrane subunit [Polaromonas sp.]|uniref:efflux transporter outer membrane subunit n=1 Tax=Polaromonas sp. TaxID=1869339 RepID=UPI002734BE51|nr:efflux transporter outer membrane subunit [Polaromonas sp.]MDP2817359.1 efflux transporter outer membrane subunit [Polaromonas sp.]
MKAARLFACTTLPLLLPACALQTPPASVAAPTPSQWFAPLPAPQPVAGLPHKGTLTDLTRWWQQQGDPLLVELIAAAQAVSPTVASARARIEQARATRVASGAALLPTLDASASVSRGRSQQGAGPGPVPISTSSQAGLQASWEIDLFGGKLAGRDAASERLAGAQALWHDARVSVAAEVASQYHSLRTCRQLASVTAADAVSRFETARLSGLSTGAGFTAPATDALARASAAEASSRATQQRALCELDIKALVALTGLAEPDIRQKVASALVPPAQAAMIFIASLPADTLAQRPDVFSAEREVAAASAEVGSAQAERYPRLSLSGSIGNTRVRAAGVSSTLDTWSIGPLALTLPLFDGGRRAANVDAAVARYEEAAALYRARVRQAVREVEEALVNLQSTAARSEDARLAAEGYRAAFTGTEARYKSGLGSLFELEDARRTLLAAETGLLSLQRERANAWVALYRATGGGWSAADGGPAPATAARP